MKNIFKQGFSLSLMLLTLRAPPRRRSSPPR